MSDLGDKLLTKLNENAETIAHLRARLQEEQRRRERAEEAYSDLAVLMGERNVEVASQIDRFTDRCFMARVWVDERMLAERDRKGDVLAVDTRYRARMRPIAVPDRKELTR